MFYPMFHVIDDNLIGGRNTAKIINLFNGNSQVFTSAASYMDYVKSDDYQKPDAIFTDIFMYKMNGYEMIEKILAIHPDQRFVVISGRPDLKHPLKNRACFYLSKPYYARDIEKIINEVKRCEREGPSPESECANKCDCSEFALSNWICPLSQTPKTRHRKRSPGQAKKTVRRQAN